MTSVFAARPPGESVLRRPLALAGARRREFTGSAGFLADPANRARVAEYLTDMARPYAIEVAGSTALGHSYGEMAEPLIAALVPPDQPVDLLVLAFSVHDLRPGRPTAAYLSHVTPGSPMAFAICDQGSAAPFTGLRIVREYSASAGVRRALLIVAEQAALPYDCPAPMPSRHRAIAMLYGDCTSPQARVVEISQHPGVPPEQVAELVAKESARLLAGRRQARLVLSDSLAAAWSPAADWPVRVIPAGHPVTGVWWGLVDELSADADDGALLVLADYDPGLRYLCLTAVEKEPAQWETG
jgi:4-hydroxymandelate oxidase